MSLEGFTEWLNIETGEIKLIDDNKHKRDRLVNALRSIADMFEDAKYADEIDINCTFTTPQPQRVFGAQGYYFRDSNATMLDVKLSANLYSSKKEWRKVD